MSTLTRSRRDRAMAIRRAWRDVGIPALVTAEQAIVLARVYGVEIHPTGPQVPLAALAVEVTTPERITL